MKKTIIIILFLIGACVIYVNKNNNKTRLPSVIKPLIKVKNNKIVHRSSIFIPYWALGQGNYVNSSYDAYYYFGVALNQNGVIKTEPGYTGLAQFTCPKTKKCYLVIRMLDNEINKIILANTTMQEKVIEQTLDIADTYNFSGIALDLELSGMFNDEVTGQTNSFVQSYYTSAKKNYKTLSFIVYGDNYFRKRPFNIKSIGAHADEIVIMAYDFHKSYGEPGPNFPFQDKNKWGYDFQQMISDFSADIPSEKLTIIFGMYGYDWTLNEQGTPLKRGEAVTVSQINKILNSKPQTLNKSQNPISKEKRIEYIDYENFKHVIYYEDEESARVKQDYLEGHGIGSISFWAWGYF